MLDDALPRPIDTSGRPDRLYPKLLGAAWQKLDPVVRRVHADPAMTHAAGTGQVSRAPGWLIGIVLDLARVPPSSMATQVRLAICTRGLVERWQRSFGGLPLVTHQSEAPGGLLVERVGILEFRFRLAVKDGALLFRQEGFAVRLGRLRLSLPDWLSLKVAAREGSDSTTDEGGDRTTVDVRVTGPTGGLLFAYRSTVCWRSGENAR